jgi:hypothetical protein
MKARPVRASYKVIQHFPHVKPPTRFKSRFPLRRLRSDPRPTQWILRVKQRVRFKRSEQWSKLPPLRWERRLTRCRFRSELLAKHRVRSKLPPAKLRFISLAIRAKLQFKRRRPVDVPATPCPPTFPIQRPSDRQCRHYSSPVRSLQSADPGAPRRSAKGET